MRGNELRDTFTAWDKVRTLGHFRPETVHRAIGATVAYIGARRLLAAARREPDGAMDRRLLTLLAEVEDAAVRLAGIPQRADYADDRANTWDQCLTGGKEIVNILRQEAAMARVKAREARALETQARSEARALEMLARAAGRSA